MPTAAEVLTSSGSLLQQVLAQTETVEAFPQAVLNDVSTTMLDTGVVQFQPKGDTTTSLVISAGVHGNETAPIEIVDRLVSDILSGDLEVGVRLLVIIGNPPSIEAGGRFVEENLNRLFNGNHHGSDSAEARRARRIEELVAAFFEGSAGDDRLHYDLHTAIRASRVQRFAIHPFLGDGGVPDPAQLRFLAASGIEAVLFANAPVGTFSYHTSSLFKAQSFTVELGAVRPFGENDHEPLRDLVRNLRSLVAGSSVSEITSEGRGIDAYDIVEELFRHSEEDFTLHIDEATPNFTEYPEGYRITSDIDGGYVTPSSGLAIVFPNSGVAVGQRCVLIVQKRS